MENMLQSKNRKSLHSEPTTKLRRRPTDGHYSFHYYGPLSLLQEAIVIAYYHYDAAFI